jgi:uncharacterized protein (DUF1800 family)
VAQEQQRINALADEGAKQTERKALNDKGNHLAYGAARREILRALYSPAQLQGQLDWFWLNHFSVFQYKASDAWLVGDYAENAIRAHALGHFRDLVLATLTHPAMLQYLDNAQNAAGHINENYARELMELHTLGVGSGYTQQDIQELARVLTGVARCLLTADVAMSVIFRSSSYGLQSVCHLVGVPQSRHPFSLPRDRGELQLPPLGSRLFPWSS